MASQSTPSQAPAQNDPYMDMEYQQMQQQRPMTITDVAFGLVVQFGFDLLQRAITSPSDRMVLLSTVEGELKQQGRLPPVTGFGGIIKCAKRIYRKEGLSGFFRGVLTDTVLAFPAMFADGLATNLVFALLQISLPTQIANNLGPVEVAILSVLATGAAVLVSSPINAVRKTITTNYAADIVAPVHATEEDAKAQDAAEAAEAAGDEAPVDADPQKEEGYRYGNAQECAKTIYRYGGWRAFYRSALIDPLTMCVYRGLYIAASVSVPPYFQVYYPLAVARGLAVVADVVTQPFEVISRRLVMTASAEADEAMAQLNNTNEDNKEANADRVESAPHRYRYEGVIDCVQTIMREEGWQALFAGLRCRLAMTGLSMALRASLSALNGGGDGQ